MQEQQNITANQLVTLPPSERAAIALSSGETEAKLHELVKQSAGIVEVKDTAGREEAHRAGMTLKNTRIAIEKTGKAAREDATAFSNAVIQEERRLKAIIAGEEDRIFGLRDAFDQKLAAEKAERERIERERVATIKAKIDAIGRLPMDSISDTADEILATITDLEQLPVNQETFAEFTADATAVRERVLGELRTMREAAVARAAEAERVAKERAEIERMQAELERTRKALEEATKAAQLPQVAVPADGSPVVIGTVPAGGTFPDDFVQTAVPFYDVAEGAGATISVATLDAYEPPMLVPADSERDEDNRTGDLFNAPVSVGVDMASEHLESITQFYRFKDGKIDVLAHETGPIGAEKACGLINRLLADPDLSDADFRGSVAAIMATWKEWE